jgi:hypothetical protein
MHARSLLAATLFALTSFVAASPPGCLLGAVNTYSEPADIKSVCSEKDVTNTIAKFCGDSSKQALEAFADICNGAGVKVGKYNCPSCVAFAKKEWGGAYGTIFRPNLDIHRGEREAYTGVQLPICPSLLDPLPPLLQAARRQPPCLAVSSLRHRATPPFPP